MFALAMVGTAFFQPSAKNRIHVGFAPKSSRLTLHNFLDRQLTIFQLEDKKLGIRQVESPQTCFHALEPRCSLSWSTLMRTLMSG